MKEHPTHKGYFLTEDGKIFSCWRRGKYPVICYNDRRELSQKIDNNGYCSIVLNGRTGKRYRVHRLMLETYCPINDYNCLVVNHKDGNRSNNTLKNLEWMTQSQNIVHGILYGKGKIPTGKRQEVAKKTNSQTWKCLESGYVSTAAGVVAYQKARGIDTAQRVRIN